jgi:hypothetical protein
MNLWKLVLSPTGSINLGFILREDLLLCSSYLPLGVPNWAVNYTPSVCSRPLNASWLGWLTLPWKSDAMLCFWIGMKIKLQPQWNTWVEWYCLVYIEWLLRTTYQEDLTRVCGADLRVSTLVVCHPGQKRLQCLPCLVSFQCSLMILWALSWLSKLWGFNSFAWHWMVFGNGYCWYGWTLLLKGLVSFFLSR